MIIFGLGNVGGEYENTRHNIGFLVLDQAAEKLGFEWGEERYLNSQVAKDTEYMLLKPSTLVNKSGDTLRELLKRREIDPSELVVVHDDTEIPFGEVRVKIGGTSGGHNGIKSLDDVIGADYWRIRVGVGRPENREYDLADYVLAEFSTDEQKLLPAIVDRVSDFLVQSIHSKELSAQTFNAKEDK